MAHSDSNPVPTWCWRKSSDEFVLTDCNEVAATLLGGEEAASAGRTAREVFREVPQVLKDMAVCAAKRFSFKREVRLRLNGTENRSFIFTYVATSPDVVVLHAEEAAPPHAPAARDWHEASATLRTIYEAAPLSILGLDLEGRITKWNPAAENMFGWKAEEAIGRVCPTVPPEGMDDYLTMIREVVAHGPRTGMVFARKNRNNERIQASISAAPVLDGEGAARGVVVIMEDVTVRLRAETELAARKAELRSLVDNTGDIVMRLDRDFRYLLVNRAFLELTSRTRAEVLGRTMAEAGLASERCAFWRENVNKVFETGVEHSFEFEVAVRNELRSYHAKVAPEFDRAAAAAAVQSVVVIIRDITDRNRAEFEAQMMREKLAHVARVSALGELATVLAHELNQPLAAILANTQAAQRMLEAGKLNAAELAEILGDIAEDDHRAGEIIRRMRGMLMKGESKFEPVDLNAVIREVSALTQPDAASKCIEVTLALAPELPPVRGDRIQLQQVVLNLMVNAMDAIVMVQDGRERRLVVRTSQVAADTVAAAVEDTGVGIAPDKLEEVFEPFFTSKVNGLGTGLFISRSLIESHGGRIVARQNAGPGATFEFTLPVAATA